MKLIKVNNSTNFSFNAIVANILVVDGQIFLNFEIKEIWRVVKFLIVGGVGVFVNLGFLFLLTEIFQIYYMLSAFIVSIVVVTYNYFANNFWSFSDKKNINMKSGYGKFTVVMILYFVIYYSCLYMFTEWIVKDFQFYFIKGYMISALIAIILATLPKYILCFFWVWKK